MTRRTIVAALAALLLAVPQLGAQTVDTVRGRLVDGEGKPLAGERVVLHRVVGSSGANIAETQSDAEGRFAVPVDSADNRDAVYFLAARWEGELYIGEAFRAPLGDAEHLLQVGVPGTSASALIEGTTTTQPGGGMTATLPQSGRPATRTSWLLFAVPGIALLGVIAYLLLRGRHRIPERRRLLREVAELDLGRADTPDDEYRARRARLLERLREAEG